MFMGMLTSSCWIKFWLRNKPVFIWNVFCTALYITVLHLTTFYPIKENDWWKLKEPLLMWESEKACSLQTLLSFISLTSGSSSSASLKAFFPLIFPRQAHKLSSLLYDQRWDRPWSKAAFPPFFFPQEFSIYPSELHRPINLLKISLFIVSLL